MVASAIDVVNLKTQTKVFVGIDGIFGYEVVFAVVAAAVFLIGEIGDG